MVEVERRLQSWLLAIILCSSQILFILWKSSKILTDLFVGFFEVLHEHGNDHVDQHELGHQHKDDEENGRNDGGDAAVAHTVGGVVARLTQRVFHDAVPVVAGGHPEQRQERHAEVVEVRVLAQTLARNFLAAFCRGKSVTLKTGQDWICAQNT